jgi:Zn-dependent M28 family amino/carboxypeptidase
MIKFLLPLLLATSACLFSQNLAKDKSLRITLTLPDQEVIKERIRYLADDALRGRKPGTPGYEMAVAYVVDQFKKIGVEPKGDDGYLQKVTLRTGKVDTLKVSAMWNGLPLRVGKDITILPDMNRAENGGEGEVMFVGHGISARHLGHDDFAGIDVKGKIVLMVSGVPEKFPASERAHFNSMAVRAEVAAEQGAIGAIGVVATETAFKSSVEAAVFGTRGTTNRDGSTTASRVPDHASLKFYAIGSSAYFKPVIEKLKKGDRVGTVKVKSATTFVDLVSHNVVGWIPGTDEKLKAEFVVHTAHLDHVGIGKKIKGDSIYNGAHDNASGVSCALEIAKLYKSSKVRRSIIIALVTAEEMGLLGSSYFASNPPVDKSKIVADINTDMPTLIAPLLSIEPLGAKHSSLMNEVVKAAKYLNLEVMEDHIPDQVRFVRSDQYSFIREGVPALHIKYGLKTNDPSIDLKKKIEEWTVEHYHKPSDEYKEGFFDFSAAVTYIKLNFLIGYQIANAKQRPEWNKGDFFGETFGRVKHK